MHQHPNMGPLIPRGCRGAGPGSAKRPVDTSGLDHLSVTPLSENVVPERVQGRDKTTGDMEREELECYMRPVEGRFRWSRCLLGLEKQEGYDGSRRAEALAENKCISLGDGER